MLIKTKYASVKSFISSIAVEVASLYPSIKEITFLKSPLALLLFKNSIIGTWLNPCSLVSPVTVGTSFLSLSDKNS